MGYALKDFAEAWRIPPQVTAVAAAAVYFWPHARSAWVQFRGGRKEVRDVRTTLELLKLRCEIEALRRTHNLTEAQFTPPEIALPPAQTPVAVALPKIPIPTRERFLCGTGGAGLVVLALAIWCSAMTDWEPLLFFIPLIAGVPVVLAAGKVASWVGIYSRWHAMAVGFVFPLVLAGAIALLVSPGLKKEDAEIKAQVQASMEREAKLERERKVYQEQRREELRASAKSGGPSGTEAAAPPAAATPGRTQP